MPSRVAEGQLIEGAETHGAGDATWLEERPRSEATGERREE